MAGRWIPYTPSGCFQHISHAEKTSDLGLSHALESLRAGPATAGAGRSGTIGTMETVESLSAVNLQSINKSEDWHNLLHEARLEDCGVKLQSLEAFFLSLDVGGVKRVILQCQIWGNRIKVNILNEDDNNP